jgi:YidC/Oxa1 family membrane protein insertase
MSWLLVSNALTSGIAKIFHPIVYAVAWTLAFIYGIIPNYGIAIAILTILIMALLTPLTVKSTRSMIMMQRLQPELKKLQQKYKGPENRQALNEEMMKLYKEEGINPASGCIAGFLSMPFLIILYSVIRGLANVKLSKSGQVILHHGLPVSLPKDIPTTSRMYHDIQAAHGVMNTWGMNLALKPISSHGSVGAAIPFYAVIVIAVGLQYFQMSQINRRNPNKSQLSSQMQMFQRITPVLFAYIYFIVPAAAAVYMIFSSLIRILTQDLVFRFDKRPPKPHERSIAAAVEPGDGAAGDAPAPVTPTTNGKANGAAPKPKAGQPAAQSTKPSTRAAAAPKPQPSHPRARDKKKRKAR